MKVPSGSETILAKWPKRIRLLFIMLNPCESRALRCSTQNSTCSEVKQHIVDVGLCPFAAVEASQHPASGILFRSVIGVTPLACKQMLPALIRDRNR